MSKINAIRIVNLNYNNNSMKIDDEYFELNGENTLFSLMNGGGKTVLVQMIMAPFVRKTKRNLGKRAFKDYFTTNKPTFILVEWQLDGKAGYALTGMMVRKNQSIDTDFAKEEDLDVINFIYEYKSPNAYDIRNIPIIDNSSDRKTLKGYQSCEKLFEEMKNKKGNAFSYYNANNYAQQRNYFDKLEQYQIYHSEWETIIREVNQKESGLSELFSKAKDELGLLEQWFLKTIDDKLNKNGDRIKSFEELMSKCIKQYKDNNYKIMKKQSMLNFKRETESIYKNAISYQNSLLEKQRTQTYIAELLLVLKELSKNYQIKAMQQQENINALNEEISDLNYQSLCYKIILKLEEIDLLNRKINSINTNKESCSIELKEIEQSRNLLLCAKKYQELQAAYLKVNEYENKLAIINNKNIDLAPRRNELGYVLKCHYEKEYQRTESKISRLAELTEKIISEIKQFDDEAIKLNENSAKTREEISAISTCIKFYDDSEERFNTNYKLKLSRNILGLYEENYLEKLKIKNENILETLNKSYSQNQRKKFELEKEQTENDRNIEELIKNSTKLNSDYEIQVKKDELNENKLVLRRDSIRYISSVIEDVFDTDKINEEFNKKIKDIETQKKLKEKELDEEQVLYKNLELGRVLEISSELHDAFENEEINYVYGMDWLNKNGYTQAQNEKMLLENPMIPYSIIMSSRDLLKLRKSDISIFTSEAIPILLREYLDVNKEVDVKTGAVFELNKELSFYVLFNKDILDKDKLSLILEEKRQKLKQITEIIDRRKAEIDGYTEKRILVTNQSLTKEDYYGCKSEIERLKKTINDIDNILITAKQKKEELTEKNKNIDEAMRYQVEELKEKERLTKDISELIESYNEYIADLDQKSYLLKQVDMLKIDISKNNELKLSKSRELDNNRSKEVDLLVELEKIKINNGLYSSFSASSENTEYLHSEASQLESIDIAIIESEFKVISDKISSSQKEIEDNLNAAIRIANDVESNLNKIIKKYNILNEEYKEISYNELEEESMEKRQEQINSILLDLSVSEKPLLKEQGKLDNQKEALYNELKAKFETVDILAIEKIRICDFNKELFDLSIKVENELKILNQIRFKSSNYQNSESSLMEYEEYEKLVSNTFDPMSIYEEVELLEEVQLSRNITLLKRDFREKLEMESNERGKMAEEINRISALQEFQDDFYKNPLKNLYDCRNTPSQVIEQLDTNWKAYSTLLEKLQIDIDMIEKEKGEIVNLFTQYVQTVHNNLDSIDRNSSINIRGRSVKMLKIILPNWEDEEGTYKLRVNEFVESLISSGIRLLENNEQIEDMLGKQIKINNIYNSVVGCSKVSIRLYKIEANKEVAITWAEAAKNSGGEGFLSAFVILSSLMMYLRRDETDIFLEKEEGKVLIMDNPFAQTSSEHLLKPLMEISKKSNTQLICLSALGGDSIYNRFDNIYVLNHTSSKLQSGISYLKAEHAKGEESTKNMISSRILAEENEQLSLF